MSAKVCRSHSCDHRIIDVNPVGGRRQEVHSPYGVTFRCSSCGIQQFKRRHDLQVHEHEAHSSSVHSGFKCHRQHCRKRKLQLRKKSEEPENMAKTPGLNIISVCERVNYDTKRSSTGSEYQSPKRRLAVTDDEWSGDENTNDQLTDFMDSIDGRDCWSDDEDTDVQLSRLMESIEGDSLDQNWSDDEDTNTLLSRFMESVEGVKAEDLSWNDETENKLLENVASICETYIEAQQMEVPEYIIHNNALYSLVGDTNGRYKDHLSFFRCLVTHRIIQRTKRHSRHIQRPTKGLFAYYVWCTGIVDSASTFQGVGLSDLPLIEELFCVNIRVFALLPPGRSKAKSSVRLLRESPCRYAKEDTLILNFYNGHFSYVFNWLLYSADYPCNKCTSRWTSPMLYVQHAARCNGVME